MGGYLFVEGGKVRVPLLDCEGAEGKAEGDVVEGVGLGGVGDGGVWDRDLDLGSHGGATALMEADLPIRADVEYALLERRSSRCLVFFKVLFRSVVLVLRSTVQC